MKKYFKLVLILSIYSSFFYGTLSDLNETKYEDTEGNKISYDHQERIKDIVKFSNQGKNIHLILGRGTKEVKEKDEIKKPIKGVKLFYDYTEPLGDKNNIWVYASYWEKVQEYGKYPHLIFDFNDTEELDSVPNDIFKSIAFDESVTKYIFVPVTTFTKLGKKLIEGGYLYILPTNVIRYKEDPTKNRYCSSEEYMEFYKEKLKSTLDCSIENNNYPVLKKSKGILYLKCSKKII